MIISTNFQKFVFGVVLPQIRKAPYLIFREFDFKCRPAQISSESLRELLKHLDQSYPRDDKKIPVSYTKLTSKDMNNHIEWIILICGESSFTPDYIEAEWERLTQSYK
jgi:prophage antirepressor-like protein